MSNTEVSIVFVHKGYSSYLQSTLEVARIVNPSARLFLIGDADNEEVAKSSGWSHVHFQDLENED